MQWQSEQPQETACPHIYTLKPELRVTYGGFMFTHESIGTWHHLLTFYSGLLSGIYSDILSGMYSDILFGILSGILSAICSGFTFWHAIRQSI